MQPRVLDNGSEVVHKVLEVIEFVPPQNDAPASPNCVNERKKLLQFAILLVGAVTFLMGCLPTYGQIGIWAPILLVLLRFLQGFAVGGEWGGAVLLVAEHSPNKERAFWASWPQAAVPVGNLLATVVLLVLTACTFFHVTAVITTA